MAGELADDFFACPAVAAAAVCFAFFEGVEGAFPLGVLCCAEVEEVGAGEPSAVLAKEERAFFEVDDA